MSPPTRLLDLRILAAAALATALPTAAMAQNVGTATWYGARHSGTHTSNGEVFDEEGMTAASNRLPIGARVRVTMDSGRSVVVRVNDRMGSHSTFIDLTKGAARQIGLLGRGRATVSIDATSDEPLEVAEATEDDVADITSAAPRGRRRMRRGGRSVSLARQCCLAPSVILARHSVQPRAARHRL
jgi:rare lipoprotein A